MMTEAEAQQISKMYNWAENNGIDFFKLHHSKLANGWTYEITAKFFHEGEYFTGYGRGKSLTESMQDFTKHWSQLMEVCVKKTFK